MKELPLHSAGRVPTASFEQDSGGVAEVGFEWFRAASRERTLARVSRRAWWCTLDGDCLFRRAGRRCGCGQVCPPVLTTEGDEGDEM